MSLTSFFLPLNASKEQQEIYDKNCKLYALAFQNQYACGDLFSLCADLGNNDFIIKDRFFTVYPYSGFWYKLAYGKEFNQETDTEKTLNA